MWKWWRGRENLEWWIDACFKGEWEEGRKKERYILQIHLYMMKRRRGDGEKPREGWPWTLKTGSATQLKSITFLAICASVCLPLLSDKLHEPDKLNTSQQGEDVSSDLGYRLLFIHCQYMTSSPVTVWRTTSGSVSEMIHIMEINLENVKLYVV